MSESSTVVQCTSSWPGLSGIKRLVVFGASYCAIGDVPLGTERSATLPLGIAYPGDGCYTDRDLDTSAPRPNWIGHLLARYWPEPRFRPATITAVDSDGRGVEKPGDESSLPQDPAYMRDPLLVFDYAHGGHTVPQVLRQISEQFKAELAPWRQDIAGAVKGENPWRSWTSTNALFVTWVGINDCASMSSVDAIPERVDQLFAGQIDLYASGARNFLLVDVPHIDRSPAVRRTRAPYVAPRYRTWNATLLSRARAFATAHPDATVLLFSSARTIDGILDEPDIYGLEEPVGPGLQPADVRRAYGPIWADQLHPTSAVHDVLARDMAEFLSAIPVTDNLLDWK